MRKSKRPYIVNESIFENEDEFVRFCNMSLDNRIKFLKERDITFKDDNYEKEI